MEKDIYFEWISMSKKDVGRFEDMYLHKKNDIINAVLKSIETKKIENACYWASECIVSGYVLALWEKLIIFSSKMIHINNPNLPVYLLKRIYYPQILFILMILMNYGSL